MRVVIGGLLKRGLEMADVYQEVINKAPLNQSWQTVILTHIVECAATHRSDRMREVREAISNEKKLLKKISSKANELANLLAEYGDIREQHSISSPEGFTDPFELMDFAANSGDEVSCLYQWHIKEKLQPVRQFKRRYYPGVPSLLVALSTQAATHVPHSTDSFDAVAVKFRKQSHGDYYRSLLHGLELGTVKHGGHIPDKFNLTDGAIATIINCCFDLDAEVSSDDVKGWRKEVRIRGKKID